MSSAVKAHVGPLKLSPPQAKPTLEHRLHSQEHGVDRERFRLLPKQTTIAAEVKKQLVLQLGRARICSAGIRRGIGGLFC